MFSERHFCNICANFSCNVNCKLDQRNVLLRKMVEMVLVSASSVPARAAGLENLFFRSLTVHLHRFAYELTLCVAEESTKEECSTV